MSGGREVSQAVEREILEYESSGLERLLKIDGTCYVVKYVASRWAAHYIKPGRLNISQTPALTWGTGTYVSPIGHPLSAALYGRCGIVAQANDCSSWHIFDARRPSARAAYVNWARAQPIFNDLVLTVHSTYVNHLLRDTFRREFQIDCVMFRPDQVGNLHTDKVHDSWLLVTDWQPNGDIDTGLSTRLVDARFTILIDEEFDLIDDVGLPLRAADRRIEAATLARTSKNGFSVVEARSNLNALSEAVVGEYRSDGFVHVWIEP